MLRIIVLLAAVLACAPALAKQDTKTQEGMLSTVTSSATMLYILARLDSAQLNGV